MQSSRSKSQRKGCLLRFRWNSTATSGGSAYKLGNNVWHDSESITTKVCSQISCKCHVESCIDRTSVNFYLKILFYIKLLLKIFIYCVTNQPSPNFQVLTSHFPEVKSWLMNYSMRIERKLCKENFFYLQSIFNATL